MIKKISIIVTLIITLTIVYFLFLFDINNYKSDLERVISKKANITLIIDGDLELNLGPATTIKAERISIKKNDALILSSKEFKADVSISQVLKGRFDINSVSLLDSKLYGLNIDESIIQAYSLLSGQNYYMQDKSLSKIESINARGYYVDDTLQIDDIKIKTQLIKATGFGKIKPNSETINITAVSAIMDDELTKQKYGQFFPKYLSNTEVPILISGNYTDPEIDIKISDIIAKKIREEIKNRAIDSIKEKIKEKLQSDINIKLPF